MERLETQNLVLRRPNASDWPAARDFFMSERAEGVGGPYSLGQAWRAFASEVGHWDILGYGMWTVTRRGEDHALGMIGAWCPADWPENEIGWMVWEAGEEGRGLATEAAKAAIHHAWHSLGWQTIVSYVAPENTRSIRLAEKLGAQLDPNAPQPVPGKETLVFRHPKPEGII